MDDLENRMADFERRMDGIEWKIGYHKSRIDDFERGRGDHKSRIDGLKDVSYCRFAHESERSRSKVL